MLKRWLIRAVFMLPILLCVVGWGWSYVYEASVAYDSPDELWGMVRRGHLYIGHVDCVGKTRWYYGQRKIDPLDHEDQFGWHVLGFSVNQTSDDPRTPAWEAGIPLWFPTTISTLALLLAWRKTRPRKPRGAFPVEMAAKEGKA